MKKLLIVGLASILLTGLVACKQNNATDQTAAPADQATATQPATPNATQPTDTTKGTTDQTSNTDQGNKK